MTRPSPLALVPAAALTGAAGLHVVWGMGSSFPCQDRVQLADSVAGTKVVPPASACFVVAGSLAASAAVVAGIGRQHRLAALARVAVAAALGMRGLTGVTGTTQLLVPWSPSTNFQELDRRRYGPLCLVLSAAIALSEVLG